MAVGCPDPTPATPVGPNGSAPTAGPSGGPGGAAPPADGGAGGNPQGGRFVVADGAGIRVSGTIQYEGAGSGRVQVDFLQLGENNQRTLVHSAQTNGLGAWSELAPKGFGDVYVMAFMDKDGDGPSPTDPTAVVGPLTLGDENIAGVVLMLSDSGDLGPLSLSGGGPGPGAAPPEGADIPPPEGNPEGGTRPADGTIAPPGGNPDAQPAGGGAIAPPEGNPEGGSRPAGE